MLTSPSTADATGQTSPEKILLIEIFMQALEDAKGAGPTRSAMEAERYQQDAHNWFFSDKWAATISLPMICDAFGLDLAAVRKHIKRQLANGT